MTATKVVDNFINSNNGKGVDFDGAYGNQCMDLYQKYNKEVVGAFHVPNPAAADVWNNYPINHYTKIPNSPTAEPQKGDVVIWKKAASLPYGHIAIAIGDGDTRRFKSFDQNWPTGTVCHIQEHNYTNVIGWLRPNKFVSTTPEPPAPTTPPAQQATISLEDAIKDAYQGLTGQQPSTDEVKYRLNEKKPLREIIDDICKSDQRFKDKWINPHLIASTTDSSLIARVLNFLKLG